MRVGRLQRGRPTRPAYKNHGRITPGALLELMQPALATSSTAREHLPALIARSEADRLLIAAQPPAMLAALRASVAVRLRRRGYTIEAAYRAHRLAVVELDHDTGAASAWRSAIAAAAALLRSGAA